MEKSQFEKPFCHSSHRHLRSQTYRTLIQILSACYDHSQVSSPQQPRPGMCERGESVSPNSLVIDYSRHEKEKVVDESFEITGVEDSGSRDQRMVIDQIEDMLQTEDDSNLSEQKGLMVGDDVEWTACQDMGFDRQRMLIDELEHIVKGSDELVEENIKSFADTSMAENQRGVVALVNNLEEHPDVQQISIEESGNEAQLEGDEGTCNVKVSESFNLSLGKSMDCHVSKPSENIEDRSPFRTNELELQHEMQQKEIEPEKVGHNNGIVGSDISEDVEVEEGEVSGDFEVNDISHDICLDDSVVSEEKKVDEKQVSQDIIDKREFASDKQNKVNENFYESTSFIMNAVDHGNSERAVELEESVRSETQFKSISVVHRASMMAIDSEMYNRAPIAERNKRKASVHEEGVVYPAMCLSNPPVNGEILEQSATGMQGIASKEKLDSGVGNKRKRGTPSKEKKAKKKKKKGERRAEKNRQLGVKRLKLRPVVVKPKPVAFCRHYLMGRCHEDNCKFSHDTVPLTKSKPCCHFTRNSCMKGDDCPFDHQLSKYPCNNFVDKGFCNRGDNCMFSHKIQHKEDALPALSGDKNEPQPPSLLNIPNSQKQPSLHRISHQKVDVSNFRMGSSCKSTEPNVAETVVKPALAPKGINCLFLGKSSGKIKQGNSSPKWNANGKVGNQPEPSASTTSQNMNETPNKTPATVTAKGVNFLSFGNAPLEYPSGKKLSSLLLNSEDGLKSSLVNNVSDHNLASSTCDGLNNAKIGNQTTQSVSSTIQMSNETLKKITPLGMSFLSNKKALTYASTRDEKNWLPSSSGSGIGSFLLESQNTPDKHQNSSGIPWRLLGSSLASGQTNSTANSAQKAVECTLAIASKIKAPAVSNEFYNEMRGKSSSSSIGTSGGALKDSTKVSKILEFLSGFGNKN